MQTNLTLPITRDLVLIGGGHTHALVLKKWAMAPLAGAQVTLINPQAKAPYTGMLPGFVAGHYRRGELDIDLVRLARQSGARLIIDRATGIDTAQKKVHLAGRPSIAYDTVSIDIGITSQLSDLSGFEDYGVGAKPLGLFADAWTGLVEDAAQHGKSPNIAIIGAGVAGVELALAVAHRLENLGIGAGKVRLLEARQELLPDLGASTRGNLLAALRQYQVELVLGVKPVQINQEGIQLSGAPNHIGADFIVSAAGARPHKWLSATGLELTDGYIDIDQSLRSTNTPNVFAAGDCAHFSHRPLAKAGVFAVRQAPILFHNLQADLSGQAMQTYRPQKTYLKLISKGGRSAVGDKWGVAMSGPWVWKWKDRIDEAFMQAFETPRARPAGSLPRRVASGVADLLQGAEPACGGCGAKVARTSLLEGLSGVESLRTGMDDAAIIQRGEQAEVFTTDHLRAFGPDPWLLARVAAVHALGDIWAMGAQPETILSHIILPPLAPAKQALMIEEIMRGAGEVFQACGAQIAGGHTSSGAELTIGFSITGSMDTAPVMQSGAGPGDVLVLTKPIGTGTVLAAEMRQIADGDDYLATLNSMSRLMTKSAGILAGNATAMTDVTGFGLAGHLMSLLEASDVSARISLGDIPVLPGAEALSARGVRSTLFDANAEIGQFMTLTHTPRADLLFDPQTCGGLLASIPASKIDAVLLEFENAGESIWRIGEVLPGPRWIDVLST